MSIIAFLEKITDDMYVELTPQGYYQDLRNMLIDAIPGFEFPRHNLYDYIQTEIKDEDKVLTTDFILGMLWDEMPEDSKCVLVWLKNLVCRRINF